MRVCADMHVGLCERGTSGEGGKGKGCLLTVGHETPPPAGRSTWVTDAAK